MGTSNTSRPSTFGFQDGKFYTRQSLHVALLRALGFRAERLERDSAGDCWYCVEPTGGVARLTLPEAVTGIHDPRCLGGSDKEKVEFARAVQAHYQTVLQEVKRAD
jgi:hypothetical protein